MEKVFNFIKKYKLWIIIFAIITATLAIDQYTKVFFEMREVEALKTSSQGAETIVLVEGWLEFRFVKNDGAAIGMFSGEYILFLVVTIIGIPFFCGFLYHNRKKHLFGNIGLALIISGAAGNAVDRFINAGENFFSGYVRDFVDMHFFICNVADICMSIGVAMLLISIIFLDTPKKSAKSASVLTPEATPSQSAEETSVETVPSQSADETSVETVQTPDGR